jgi:predicted nucleic acid-binding protein
MQKIYIDSNIILARIYPANDEQEKASKRIIFNLQKYQNYKVVIPQIVLAEIFSKLLDSKNRDGLLLLFDQLSNIISSTSECLPNATKNMLELAIDIVNNDNKIDICDATIVAQAILDDADMLLTFDASIRESEYIQKVKKEYNKKLRITDSL